MASSASARGGGFLSPAAVAAVLALAAAVVQARGSPAVLCVPRVFSFGDSLADTGNFPFLYGNDSREPALRPPYGDTFFRRSTGRFSDGRLIVDFIADTMGLPFVRPYLSGRTAEDFASGANFAVGGAMALGPDYFRGRGVPMGDRMHLGIEMKWFRDLLDLLCPGNRADCTDMVNQSLFLVGEIGGNDYNIPLLSRVPFEKIRTFTPSVIAKISSTVTELIGLGAKTLVVPGNLPIGCIPNYLMIFKSEKKEDYEPETGCLRWMNEFSKYHNRLLVDELEKLRNLHSGVSIIYADYYGAAMEVYRSPEQFGIEHPLAACCGGGGPYGVSMTARCGYGEYKVCDDPHKYGSWDGFHPSEAAYKGITIGLLRGTYTQPSIATTISSCPQLTELGSSIEYKNCSTVLHIKAVAQVILVPGNFPIGCVPAYLNAHRTNSSADYDEFHCLKWFNDFSQKHNQEIIRLKSQNPGVKIIYADYYGAAMEFVRKPHKYGIDDPLVACCGGNGPYHTGKSCNKTAIICGDPAKFASWDQLHMTDKAYNVIADGVLNGPYADTPLLHAC